MTPPPGLHWPLCYVLPPMGALPTAPRTARAHVSDVLGQWGPPHAKDTAVLVTSELVTNAVRQCHDPSGRPVYINGRLPVVQLSLFSDRERLLIAVYDQAPGTPEERHPGHHAETGRGLALISSLGHWDWYPVEGGKVVRAILAAAA
jgi:anti-sigma regulatory factor (Ser/Thr protein kinase)